jgi:hypothetical protein
MQLWPQLSNRNFCRARTCEVAKRSLTMYYIIRTRKNASSWDGLNDHITIVHLLFTKAVCKQDCMWCPTKTDHITLRSTWFWKWFSGAQTVVTELQLQFGQDSTCAMGLVVYMALLSEILRNLVPQWRSYVQELLTEYKVNLPTWKEGCFVSKVHSIPYSAGSWKWRESDRLLLFRSVCAIAPWLSSPEESDDTRKCEDGRWGILELGIPRVAWLAGGKMWEKESMRTLERSRPCTTKR